MSASPGSIVIGTRGSALARWQAAEVGRLLRAAHPGLEVSEKIVAAFEAAASLLAGATPAAIVQRYREHVAANARRLSANEAP